MRNLGKDVDKALRKARKRSHATNKTKALAAGAPADCLNDPGQAALAAAFADIMAGKTFIVDEYDPPRGLVMRECAECGHAIGTKLDGTAPKSCVEHN